MKSNLTTYLKQIWLEFCGILALFFIGCLIIGYQPFGIEMHENEPQESEYKALLEDSIIEVKTYQDLENTLKSQQTAIYFLGYESCPWCEDALPILVDEAKQSKVTIHYINTKGLKNDKDNYQMMQDLLKPILNSDKKIYFPNVIAIKNGKIQKNHIGTVESYNPNEREMTSEEKQQLRIIYKDILEVIQ